MNMVGSSFLCLDIGASGVRGIAHVIQNARIERSAYYAVDSFDTVYALKSVIDELEESVGSRFNTAYITGNFGSAFFKMTAKSTVWQSDHKISPSDLKSQISDIDAPENFFPMHIFPLRYDTPKIRNMLSPIGHTDRQLVSAYSGIFFSWEQMNKLTDILRHAHIQGLAFYTPQFLENAILRTPKKNTLFLDFGAEYTTASIWTERGPIWYNTFAIGGNDLTSEISTKMNIPFLDAERIKRTVASLRPTEMDRFLPADTEYEFSRADVNDVVISFYNTLVFKIKSDAEKYIEQYTPTEIILGGGGTCIEGCTELVSETFEIPVKKIGTDSAVRTLGEYIWRENEPHRRAYLERSRKIRRQTNKILRLFRPRKKHTKTQFFPIMPSTLCFDMSRPETYQMFKSGGISIIHVDIMDGLYVDRIASGIDELRMIRKNWNGHLHVHLMTEAPSEWATSAISAGADTIILSTNTSGLRNAIQIVKKSGKRVGIALNPDSSVSLLKTVLRDLDEVMLMAVQPGAAGQKFDENILQKISILNATRKKYRLKFKISIDGGINAETAQKCWNAGADLLVSGSYLATAPDFPLAVLSLAPQKN